MRRAVAEALRMEAGNWRSLARWVARRPAVAADGVAFGYRSTQVAPILVFTAVSMIEVVGVDLILRPWPVPRAVLLVLGVWGVLFCLGMLASVIVHPHVVEPTGVRVRSATALDLHLPWAAIAGVRRVRRSHDGRTVHLDGAVLHVTVSKETTVEITLVHPVTVTVRGEEAEITALRMHVDDTTGFVATVRHRIEVTSGR